MLTEGDDATSAIDCLLEGSIDCCLCSLIDGAPVPFSDQLDYAPFPQGREEVMAWVDTSGPLAAENPVPRDRLENITIPLVSRPTSQMSREWIHGICEQLDHQPTCTSRYGESINSFLLNQLKATDVQFLPAHYRHQPIDRAGTHPQAAQPRTPCLHHHPRGLPQERRVQRGAAVQGLPTNPVALKARGREDPLHTPQKRAGLPADPNRWHPNGPNVPRGPGATYSSWQAQPQTSTWWQSMHRL